MRSFGAVRKFVYSTSEWLYIGCTLGAASLGWVNGLDGNEPWLRGRPILFSIISDIQAASLYIYIIIGIVAAACFIVRRRGDPWIYDKLQFILDEYQGKVFSNGNPKDHDRVTIFQHKKNCLFVKHWSARNWLIPWGDKPFLSNYLIPVLRSGHISQKSKAIFHAPDESDKAEGVAAMAWARRRSVVLNDLPEVIAGTSRRDKERYAKTTKCDIRLLEKYVAEGRQPPRSIAAIPIDCNGKAWGVVVLDSRSPQGVTDDSVTNYTLTVSLIGQLLERA